MATATITKPVGEVAVGDIVQTEDGFTLSYMRVTAEPSIDSPRSRRADSTYVESWYVLVGEDPATGDPGELYLAMDDTIEVVTNPAELVLPAPPEDPDEDRAYQAYADRQVNGEAR